MLGRLNKNINYLFDNKHLFTIAGNNSIEGNSKNSGSTSKIKINDKSIRSSR